MNYWPMSDSNNSDRIVIVIIIFSDSTSSMKAAAARIEDSRIAISCRCRSNRRNRMLGDGYDGGGCHHKICCCYIYMKV